jgi:hypothetical protein
MTSLSRAFSLAPWVAAAWPAAVQAGMPTITLTDVARMRVQTVSFFLVLLLLSAGLIQWIWNRLGKDFAFLPRLTYGKAVGLVGLWGLLFVLVLTMISGARELMTPGAWEKQGLTYRLAQPVTPSLEGPSEERRQQMESLREALWAYAGSHGGRFPHSASVEVIPPERWLLPGSSRLRYLYQGGLTADRGRTPLAYEPGVYGSQRLVLLTNGEITRMDVEEIVQALQQEGP